MTVQASSVPAKKASVALIRSWPLTLFSSLLFPLLLCLGFWQLHRAGEKAAINAAIDARLSSQPRSIIELGEDLDNYQPVRLHGRYTDEYYLLDNQTRNGRPGYEVLQIFVSGGQRWIINRGWVAAPPQRNELPEIHWPMAAKVITGFLYPVATSDKGRKTTSEKRIQRVNTVFTGRLQLARPDWSIRLTADSDTALVTDWQLLNSPPERHQAYATQWFAMAIALVILWFFTATNLPRKLRE
ncbi:SURF1 family protein [Microbulbifer thermotolerans]|uniref:SURF1 family protein n=1 Tax=Microbulbifer thermotolerans TaxID=252514 RepID=UPI00224987CB|nr:SURF1 family protein [Microbulbifer thermotolerans]MCX2830856.1 SURF1 family protein [Microbulbifer thermotolerans]MCX2833458.1 SURF1 family protein [Microbulbifer thermotolerans]WKT60661.1 SURF1 family protein [Microbulbifer thermotolerans]